MHETSFVSVTDNFAYFADYAYLAVIIFIFRVKKRSKLREKVSEINIIFDILTLIFSTVPKNEYSYTLRSYSNIPKNLTL